MMCAKMYWLTTTTGGTALLPAEEAQRIVDRLGVASDRELKELLERPEIKDHWFLADEIRAEQLNRRKIEVPHVYDDGGRAAAGFKGHAGDCVARSIAIATELDYREVYDTLAEFRHALTGKSRSAREGMPRKAYDAYMELLGWQWTPTMRPGQGCKVHLRPDELPNGRLVVRVSKHVTTMIDGVVHDTHDPSRGGTRCVYGYFSKSLD